MNIELTIEKINEGNKKDKFINMSKALSLALNIPINLNGEGIIEKAKLHRYISKEFINGKWYYRYEENKKNIDGKVEVCSAQPLKVDRHNARLIGERFLRQWRKDWQENPKKRECPALNYTKIGFDDISIKHLSVKGRQENKKAKRRLITEVMERASLLPFAKEILEGKNKGMAYTVRKDDKKGMVYYEILGQAMINEKKETISVIISKLKPDAKKYISVIKKALTKLGLDASLSRQDASMLQSIATTDYHTTDDSITGIKNKINRLVSVIKKAISKILHRDSRKKQNAMDSGGQRYINRKSGQAMQDKGEASLLQVEPSLPNIANFDNLQLVDVCILKDNTKDVQSFPNIILQLKNVTKENREIKFSKALQAVAKALNMPMGIEKEEKKGKSIYPIQEELMSYWVSFYQKLLDEVYITITDALELPQVHKESLKKSHGFIMQKAKLEEIIKPLVYKGKILYNSDTGLPIAKKDFNALIKAIEKFLNRNTKDVARRITLDNVAISKILKRLAQRKTTREMRNLTLKELEIQNTPFESVRNEYKNLESSLGEPLSNVEKLRYQVCEDYATNLITHATDTLKSDIKDVLLEGIKNKQSKSEVSQALFDKLGQHNRNWKRIVETESVNTQNLASILDDVASTPKGKKIYFKRYEMADACEACKAIDGTIALWSESAKDDIDDPYASQMLWDGKECDVKKGIVGIGTMHPHCRGTWMKWDSDFFNATEAIANGKERAWDEAVKATRAELGSNIDENSFKFRLKLQENYKKINS